MGTFKNIEEAREFAKNDRFATMAGVKVDEIGDDWCKCSLELQDTHRNGLGGVMGGAIFTLADMAFAIASNNMHSPTVAQQVNINFLSGAKGDKLYVHAYCKKDGRTTCVYNIDVTDNTGREIAQFIGTGYKL